MYALSFPDRTSFMVCIDSDGCAFDTMEIKHRQVFIPQAIRSLALQDIADEYRTVAERVNLYSRSRGANRFEALVMCLDLLRSTPSLVHRLPDPAPLKAFTASGRPLSHDSLCAYMDETTIDGEGGRLLRAVADWSAESNRIIAEIVVDNSPFPFVAESLEATHRFANTMIVSATPTSALESEWGAAGLLTHIDTIGGQEHGPKKEQLARALEAGFRPENTIMLGDAPGDHEAAKENGVMFFPIVPGSERASWRRFAEEGLARFRNGAYGGSYQEELTAMFYRVLDDHGR
ncbi:MAG: HAD family hydrolase [Spirochaetales bacterium]|nr:HAD family hydrolase [Spirochaetales bacterium]